VPRPEPVPFGGRQFPPRFALDVLDEQVARDQVPVADVQHQPAGQAGLAGDLHADHLGLAGHQADRGPDGEVFVAQGAMPPEQQARRDQHQQHQHERPFSHR
jgi:hypothetical protein